MFEVIVGLGDGEGDGVGGGEVVVEVGGGVGRVDDAAGEREEVAESEREGGFEGWEKVLDEMRGGDGWE